MLHVIPFLFKTNYLSLITVLPLKVLRPVKRKMDKQRMRWSRSFVCATEDLLGSSESILPHLQMVLTSSGQLLPSTASLLLSTATISHFRGKKVPCVCEVGYYLKVILGFFEALGGRRILLYVRGNQAARCGKAQVKVLICHFANEIKNSSVPPHCVHLFENQTLCNSVYPGQ